MENNFLNIAPGQVEDNPRAAKAKGISAGPDYGDLRRERVEADREAFRSALEGADARSRIGERESASSSDRIDNRKDLERGVSERGDKSRAEQRTGGTVAGNNDISRDDNTALKRDEKPVDEKGNDTVAASDKAGGSKVGGGKNEEAGQTGKDATTEVVSEDGAAPASSPASLEGEKAEGAGTGGLHIGLKGDIESVTATKIRSATPPSESLEGGDNDNPVNETRLFGSPAVLAALVDGKGGGEHTSSGDGAGSEAGKGGGFGKGTQEQVGGGVGHSLGQKIETLKGLAGGTVNPADSGAKDNGDGPAITGALLKGHNNNESSVANMTGGDTPTKTKADRQVNAADGSKGGVTDKAGALNGTLGGLLTAVVADKGRAAADGASSGKKGEVTRGDGKEALLKGTLKGGEGAGGGVKIAGEAATKDLLSGSAPKGGAVKEFIESTLRGGRANLGATGGGTRSGGNSGGMSEGYTNAFNTQGGGVVAGSDSSTATGGTQLFFVEHANSTAPKVDIKGTVDVKTAIFNKLNDGIGINLSKGGGEVVMKLNPESLGNMIVKMTVADDTISARLIVDSQSVKSILESDSGRLRDLLEGQGLTLEEFSIEVGLGDKGFDGFDRGGPGKGKAGGDLFAQYMDGGVGVEELPMVGEIYGGTGSSGVDLFV